MTEFSDLKYNPICPKCKTQLDLFDESTHQFEYLQQKWEETEEIINNEYLECSKCGFYLNDGEIF